MLTVDDFGKNSITNQRILNLVKLKAIQRVAILIDGKISSKEVSLLKQSGVALDIHLTLEKLTGEEKSKQAPLSRVFFFNYNYLSGKYSTQKIQLRWLKQIETFKNIFGNFPDGLNSHEHIHFFPPYFKLALDLAQICNIPFIRFAGQGLVEKNSITAHILDILWKINFKNFQKSSLNSSCFLVSFDWLKNPEKFLIENKKNDIEIVCHPERDEEYELLKKLGK